jgi:hypothetical protein
MDNKPWSEQFRLAAVDWVKLEKAAKLWEETKSAELSQRMGELFKKDQKLPVTKAEATVKATEEWKTFIENMVDARAEANMAKVQMEYLRMKFSEWNSSEATKRAEMKL